MNFYTMDDFSGVLKIDVHAHINTEATWMIDEARANNFRLMVMAVDVVPEYPPISEQLRVRIKHYRDHPDIFIFSTAFTLDGWDGPGWAGRIINQLKEDFNHGAVGVKVWKNIGMDARDREGNLIMLDDPKFDDIFRFIKDQGKVLISHTGEPKNCWLPLDQMTVKNDMNYFSEHPEYHMYRHPEFPSYEQQMEARDKMLDKNPGLTFIGAHLASLEWSVVEIGRFLDRYPNASVDLAERISHLQYQSQKDRKKIRDFFVRYQDRILYGADFQQLSDTNPLELKKYMNERWRMDWKYFSTDEIFTVPELDQPVQGLGLPKSVVDKIYRINAEKIFRDAWKAESSSFNSDYS
ncbi:MAG: amidohydrolase family protein [Cyclobacteriaceae bacterium]|nr:amidohydrolase family protein [Cyclobacteriaceae bacterium]